jgi:hypothetical protein
VQWNHAANVESQLHDHIARGFQIALGEAIVLAVVVVIYSFRRKLNEAIFVAASTTALLVLLANRLILPGTDTLVSPRPAAMWAIQTHS